MWDIFGKQIGNTYQEGLVDSLSADDFDNRLSQIESIWNSREYAYFSAEDSSSFFSYFSTYQSEVVKYHMRKDLRESVGLGSPPSIFTTNGSESINAAIKRKVNHKESDWAQFNNHIKQLMTSQHEEIIRALSQRGQYRLKPEYAHYGVTTQEWVKMRSDQRQTVLAVFEKASLKVHSFCRTNMEAGRHLPQVSTTLNSDDHHEFDDMQQCSLELSGVDSTVDIVTDLSISAEDSGITTIPIVTLNAMWGKAIELVTTDNAITPAPGSQKKACMVISYSQVASHLVQCKSNGQYICDSNCQQWVSSQICSHVLAAAEHNNDLSSFLEWYTSCAGSPNISTLALSGLPRGRGRKGGRAKCQRSRISQTPIDNVTVRPGMSSFFNNNVGVTCGPVVNVSTTTETINFQSTDIGSFMFTSNSSVHPNVFGPPPLM